ncbi:hypothetical protein BJ878DRAFT_319725 [Calycina marina]|uniref:Carbohydrate-binding module family 19 domain-containing protein n=1 Tax=Calycina marina TaxID=1763456 RepID=A0A9P8CGN2_9HELO|nr:hypothetical protein BJ878DRAFT_319725 [Calycina marina]
MRPSHVYPLAIYFLSLTAAGPLRRNEWRDQRAKRFTIVPVIESTDTPASTSTTSTHFFNTEPRFHNSTNQLQPTPPPQSATLLEGGTTNAETTSSQHGTATLSGATLTSSDLAAPTAIPEPAAGGSTTSDSLQTSSSSSTASSNTFPSQITENTLPSVFTLVPVTITTNGQTTTSLTQSLGFGPTSDIPAGQSSNLPPTRTALVMTPQPTALPLLSTMSTTASLGQISSRISDSPLATTLSTLLTTATFKSQNFTAINSLTGFSEIQPAPPKTNLPATTTSSSNQVPSPNILSSDHTTSASATVSALPTPVVTPNTPPKDSSPVTLNSTSSSIEITSLASTTSSIPVFSLINTDSTTPPSPTSEIVIDVSSLIGVLPTSTMTFSQIPTIMPSGTPGSITPAQYSSNLAEAVGYNVLFASLISESTCSSGQVACIAGQVGECNSKGAFVLDACTSGSACFAMPVNNTIGVFVGCTDKARAAEVLGSAVLSSTTGSATPTLSSNSPGGQASVTLNPVPEVPIITIIVTTRPPVLTTTVTRSYLDATPSQTPPTAAQPTPPSTNGASIYTIVPVEDSPTPTPNATSTPTPDPVADKEKETVTVTVTVTKTERA